jgi:hypothetical protein
MKKTLFFAALALSALGTASDKDCKVVMAQLRSLYPHGWHNYIDAIQKDARKISDKVLGDSNYQIQKHVLVTFVEFVLENAAGHGSQGAGSIVTYSAQLQDKTIRLTVRNKRVHPVPEKLLGQVFTPSSPPVVISEGERDRAGGVQGKGVRRLFELLPQLVNPAIEVNGPPTMTWREVETPTGPQVEFELTLPTPSRELAPHRSAPSKQK